MATSTELRSRVQPILDDQGEVVRWVLKVDSRNQAAWARQLRDWVRAVVLPRSGGA